MSREEIAQIVTQVIAQSGARAAPTEERLITITEAGAIAGQSDKMVRRLLREGKVTRYGSGRSTRVKMSEVLEALRREGQEDGAYDAEAVAAKALLPRRHN
jgi:hypothetical protein